MSAIKISKRIRPQNDNWAAASPHKATTKAFKLFSNTAANQN